MFFASLAHIYAFPITPYKRDQTQSWWWNIANAANVSDFNSEVQIHANHFYDKLKTALSRKSNMNLLEEGGEEQGQQPGPSQDSGENTRLLIDFEEPCK
jgi:hypothetical protein